MERRFLPPSYKQELFLKITSLSQENLKVEQYIQEFEQLQIRVVSNADNELTVARFIKGLSPNIANKVQPKPYLSMNVVCHLTIKIEKQLKGRRPFLPPLPHQPQSIPKGLSSHNKVDPTLNLIKSFKKGKGIASETSKRLEEKKCFKCHACWHFQADFPNWRTLSTREVEEIQAIEEEESEE